MNETHTATPGVREHHWIDGRDTGTNGEFCSLCGAERPWPVPYTSEHSTPCPGAPLEIEFELCGPESHHGPAGMAVRPDAEWLRLDDLQVLLPGDGTGTVREQVLALAEDAERYRYLLRRMHSLDVHTNGPNSLGQVTLNLALPHVDTTGLPLMGSVLTAMLDAGRKPGR